MHYLYSRTMKFLTPPLLLILLSIQVFGQDYAARKLQYLDSVQTNDYENAIIVQAFLGDPVNQDILDEIYSQFDTRSTIDFALVELVRVMFLSNGSYDAQIEAQMSTLPFWINNDDTLRNFWTENHMIMWMSCEWLMHERHGWQVDANLKQRLLHYLNLKLDVGFYEFFSSTYLPFTLSGLMNLADFAEDAEISQKAEAVARKLLTDIMLVSNSEGVFFPAAGRNYPGRYLSDYGQRHNAIIYLITGKGPCPSLNFSRADFLATSNIDFSDLEGEFIAEMDTIYSFGHSPEGALTRHDSLYYVDEIILQWSSGMYFHPYIAQNTGQLLLDSSFWGHVDFTDLSVLSSFPPSQYEAMSVEFDELTVSRTDCGANVAIYKNDETVLTSLQDYWKGKIGFQQWPIAANVGGTAVYTASGVVEQDWQARNSSNFNEHLPYIAQNGNVALIMYRPQEVSPLLPFNNKDVALHWRDSDFDSIDEDGNWIFGKRNENYIGVRRACIGEINGVRACETNGGQTWVFIVGNDNMYSSYTDFQNVVSQAVFSEEWTTNLEGDSTYYASIEVDGTAIDYTWGPEPPFTNVEEIGSKNLVIYPNPNNGSFSIQLPEINTNSVLIEVFDMLGNRVVRQSVVQTSKIELDLKTVSDGLYLIRMSSEGSFWTGRFLKQN